MLTLSAFHTKEPDRVVYWGTSGERIVDSYMLAGPIQRFADILEKELEIHFCA